MSQNEHSDDFYIGWMAAPPRSYTRLIRIVLIVLFPSLVGLAWFLVNHQKPFNTYAFEYGNVKSYTGVYFSKPFPVFIMDEAAQLPKGFSRNALLVGYGKFGARGAMYQMEKEHGNLDGKKITLLGTLIYGDGQTVLELTHGPRSLVSVEENDEIKELPQSPPYTESLHGEVIDPKCFFGAMKPGEGKVHKSCAIRCISGGIPPVLRAEMDGYEEYYILLNENGNPIEEEILPYVAEQVELKGEAYTVAYSWNAIKISEINYTSEITDR